MSKDKCTLSNEELLQRCEEWVHKLAQSGGKDWCLQVPVNFNLDPDILFVELINRFKLHPSESAGVPANPQTEEEELAEAVRQEYEGAFDLQYAPVKSAVWVKHSDKLPESNIWKVRYHERGTHSINPAMYDSHDDQNIYFKDGQSLLRTNIEWLDETGAAALSGKEDAVDNLAFIAAVTEEGAEAWKMEYDACRSILTELVDLKNIKDLEGKTDDYNLRQPVAWVRAKRFLEKYQHITL